MNNVCHGVNVSTNIVLLPGFTDHELSHCHWAELYDVTEDVNRRRLDLNIVHRLNTTGQNQGQTTPVHAVSCNHRPHDCRCEGVTKCPRSYQ